MNQFSESNIKKNIRIFKKENQVDMYEIFLQNYSILISNILILTDMEINKYIFKA